MRFALWVRIPLEGAWGRRVFPIRGSVAGRRRLRVDAQKDARAGCFRFPPEDPSVR